MIKTFLFFGAELSSATKALTADESVDGETFFALTIQEAPETEGYVVATQSDLLEMSSFVYFKSVCGEGQ